METTDFDGERVRRGYVLVWHYAQGLKAAGRHPVVKENRDRISRDADDISYALDFIEANLKELGICPSP